MRETMNDKPAPFNLNMHVARLLMNEPFFAAISRRVDKRPMAGIPTAGVRINPVTAQFEMVYNPEFFQGLTDKQKAGVLKHEFYHLVFAHVTDRKPEGVPHRKWNIAADLAINSHLRGELPDGCCMPGEGPFADLPVARSAEWYLGNLPEQQEGEGEGQPGEGEGEGEGEGDGPGQPGEGQPGQGGGGFPDGVFDDHEGWDDVPQEVKDIAKERIKDHIKKAAEEASKANSWGTVSSECRKDILAKLQSKVDWKKVLRYFIKTSQKANKRSTVRRINRRYPYQHPGKTVNRQAKIAISIDQSGSVDDEMLQAFFAELNKLATLAEFTVIPFDSSVAEDKVYVWKRKETRPWERVRYGGTDFNPPTEYVNERSFDGHIVLTDLCAPKPKRSKCQRMWMTTKYYADNPYFTTKEKVIAIDSK
jgi:predicted metal-dependent peptidase